MVFWCLLSGGWVGVVLLGLLAYVCLLLISLWVVFIVVCTDLFYFMVWFLFGERGGVCLLVINSSLLCFRLRGCFTLPGVWLVCDC